MDNHEASLEALRSLSKARPPRSAEARIVAGALERRRPARVQLRLILAGAGALAVAALVWVGIPTLQLPMEPIQVAATGDSVQGGEAPTALAVGPHQVLVDPGGRLHVEHAEPDLSELRVEAGRARFEVEPLVAGQRFKVRTDQVLVEVVGTRFSVEAAGSCSAVEVEEGRVRSTDGRGEQVFLGAGESRRFCADPGSEAGLLREALVLLSGGEELEKAAGLLSRFRASQPDAVLDEEALYHLFLLRARLGQADEARTLAGEFLDRYPGSDRAERLGQWLGANAAP
ncbi:MAG TPA: FecR domain-containing protein [Vulgatibacter sp.]|nr:FecR domain-containing protein [Vulgatibacter sp.]